MFKNYLATIFRHSLRNKSYTLINLAGLAIGMASSILIIVFTLDELSYDDFHTNADQIYRICARGRIGNTNIHQTYTCAPLPQAIINDYPEVIQAVRISGKREGIIKYQDKTFYESEILAVDSTFFEVFTHPLIKGDEKNALKGPYKVVLSASAALKYFGTDDPIGKLFDVNFDEDHQYMVTGVFRDVPQNTHVHFDILVSLSSYSFSRSDQWMNNNFKTYLVLQEGADYKDLEVKMPEFIRKYVGENSPDWDEWLASGNNWEYFFQPVRDIHLISDLNGEFEPNSNIIYIYIFSAVAIFLLLIACINFMNLSTARSAGRAKEVGIRKVEGAYRSKLIYQFLSESVFLVTISAILALILLVIFLPYFNQLTGKELTLDTIFQPVKAIYFVLLILFIGVISGIYPAFYLSSFKPALIVKGSPNPGKGRSILRSILVIFQYTLSIALITGTIMVYLQLRYFQNKDLGFNKEQILILSLPNHVEDEIPVFKETLLTNPLIKNVTLSSAMMGMDFNNWGCGLEGNGEEWSTLNMFIVDHDFLNTFSMDMDTGHFFSRELSTDSSGIVINQSAVGLFLEPGVIGKKIWFGENEFSVIGVMKDFHYESFHTTIRPAGIILSPGIWGTRLDFLAIKIGDNIPAAIRYIEKEWGKFTSGDPINYSFFDKEYEQLYHNEQRIGKVILTFAILAIFIASLGLLGLASFITEQRTREIGVRKVHGATQKKILIMLVNEFNKWLLIAAIIAAPVSWYFMKTWLENFAYRINFKWWSIIAAVVLAFIIAILTVSFQSVKASRTNPADSLRYE